MADERNRGEGRSVSPGLIGFIIVAVLLVWFALINTESVSVSWILGTSEVPLIWVIAGAALLGAIIGWIVSLMRRSRD